MKARTAHNASAMRIPQLVKAKMRPGNKQKALMAMWSDVRVLVIEEVSMMPASVYNMLDIRAAHGRSVTHDVSEMTYSHENHHFGCVPIVLHLGDFLQLTPTANLGLTTDVHETLENGTYKLKDARFSRRKRDGRSNF